jgi:hypothetical protein
MIDYCITRLRGWQLALALVLMRAFAASLEQPHERFLPQHDLLG